METKYKCEKCGSQSKGIAGTCCGGERKEMDSCKSCHGTGCAMCDAVLGGNWDMNHIKPGARAGIIAGVVFGAMMGMMGALPIVAKLFGSSSVVVGFIVHILFSAIIGALFGVFLGHKALNRGKAITLGLVWGFIWWILGPLFIMPVWLGMGAQFSAKGIAMALPSLAGHLVFGFILGLVYAISTSKK